MTQWKQTVWMALSIKLAQRIPLPLFIKHFTSSEWHVCDSISFLFSFWCMCGVCVWYIHMCACVYGCTCACRVQKGNIRFLISYFPPCSLKNLVLSLPEPGVCFSAGLSAQLTPASLVSIPPTIQHCRHIWAHLAYLMWVLEIQTLVFTRVQQALLATQPSF